MKDFSLFYGRSRSWLAVLATLVVALGIALVARDSSGSAESCQEDCAGQQIQAEVDSRRSSAPFETAPVTAVGGGQGQPLSPWNDAAQSADEVPFVSLQPSPEPMTDAGKAITRKLSAPVVQPSSSEDTEASADSGVVEEAQDEPAKTEDQPPEPEPESEPVADRAIPSDCSVRGAPLELLYIAFENYCGSSPRTCGPVEDEWYCEITRDSR